MKTSKKILTFLLCVVMMLCMAVSVSVSAAAETETVYSYGFEASDSEEFADRFYQTSTAKGNAGIAIVQDQDGNNVAEFTFKKDASSANLIYASVKNVEWEEGYKYIVSYRAKVSQSDADTIKGHTQTSFTSNVNISWSTSTINKYPAPATKPTYAKEWKTYKFEMLIDDFLSSTGADLESSYTSDWSFYAAKTGAVAGDKLMIDDIVITRTPAPEVVVSVNAGGTVERVFYSSSSTIHSYRVCENGATFYGPLNKTRKFRVTPEAGKVAVAKYNDKEVTIDKETTVEVKLTGDSTTLDIKFVSTEPEIEKTEMIFRNGAVYVYSIISEFVPNADANNFGVKLWRTGDAENSVVLNACSDDNGTLAVAQSGQAFAIKAVGAAITADGSYTAKAFVGDAEGGEVSIAE